MNNVERSGVNQNDFLLDSLRAQLGLPLLGDLALPIVDKLQPVIVVEHLTAPLRHHRGERYSSVAAGGAGTRAEIAISIATAPLFNVPGNVLECWAVCLPLAAFEIVAAGVAGILGFTDLGARSTDLRFDPLTATSPVFVGAKNSAAATAGDSLSGPITGTGVEPFYYGPIYMDSTKRAKSLIIRPTTDNQAFNGGWKWRLLRTTGKQ